MNVFNEEYHEHDISIEHGALLEKIYQSIDDESDHEDENDHEAASLSGLKTWSYLKELMPIVDARNVLDLFGHTMYDLPYWASVLTHNLDNASVNNELMAQNKYLFCSEFVGMHDGILDSEMHNLGNIRSMLADCYASKGDLKTCDDLYKKWLKKEPRWGWGWIHWSDYYWFLLHKRNPDFVKAKSILEQGLSIRAVREKSNIINRLKNIEQEIDKIESTAEAK